MNGPPSAAAGFLGSSTIGGNYTAGTLGAGTGGIYRLGTGGSTAVGHPLNVNAPVLTGGDSVQIGGINNIGLPASSAPGQNGGWVSLNTPNSYTGGTTARQGTLTVADNGALGPAHLYFNGGTILPNAGRAAGPAGPADLVATRSSS